MNKKNRLFTDTTDFFAIDCGDEILVDGRRYTVSGHERERRFGVEDPKFWVKRAGDSETGEKKIIKLSYFESFETTFGGMGEAFVRDESSRLLAVLDEAKDKLVENGFNPNNIEMKLATDPYPAVAEGIIDQFNKGNFNMVVIGRKQKSKAEEFVLGDISIKLVRALAGAAVLVVESK
ncbi:MAG: universal stress protein [Desulfobacteraceae bacterium]|nr:universal stress protein [Desulfobacteraceae bacterium]